jgi:hypothetical protein
MNESASASQQNQYDPEGKSYGPLPGLSAGDLYLFLKRLRLQLRNL